VKKEGGILVKNLTIIEYILITLYFAGLNKIVQNDKISAVFS